MQYNTHVHNAMPSIHDGHQPLTSSVTGTEPDQVFLCQSAAELSRIQSAGHQHASTLDYRSMSYGSVRIAMFETKKSVPRNAVIIM